MKEKMVEEAAMISRAIRNMNSDEAIEKYEKRALELKNPYLSYIFAKDVEGADIKKHSDIVINSGDAHYNYLFAKTVDGVDKYAHIEMALKAMGRDSFVISVDNYGTVKKARVRTKKLR